MNRTPKNRTTVITALACGLLLTTGVAAQGAAADTAAASLEDHAGPDGTSADTLLVNGRAYRLE
ncbi:hypothetical protein [Rathayibacter sp. VKM Ac-2760]|uniref:hypothetical protein n=1 Tax=Rathayibacter sp. VKM Ac-2760 TaxID=2609253 RepID=UPI00131785F2|nr:hypothetical protein [Rathayibacter sp. VKM Ac-2760]QHC60224.1 hypothetical protein GSU72_17955 [Rathayibacter sp. VKM Ac-2760]